MPTYTYICKRCKRPEPIFHAMDDKKRRRCQKCRGKLVKCITEGAGVIFKGKGFHATDYPKGGR